MSTLTLAKLFEPAQLGATLATYYTVPTPTTTLLRGGVLRFTNTTAGPITIDAHLVPKSGTAGDSNAIAKGKSVAANDYLDIEVPTAKEGDFIQAKASAATSITIHALSGNLFS